MALTTPQLEALAAACIGELRREQSPPYRHQIGRGIRSTRVAKPTAEKLWSLGYLRQGAKDGVYWVKIEATDLGRAAWAEASHQPAAK